MILLRSERAQASGSRVGANLAPVSQTSEEEEEEEDGWSALHLSLWDGGGRLDRKVCRSGAESAGDGIYDIQLQVVAPCQFSDFVTCIQR